MIRNCLCKGKKLWFKLSCLFIFCSSFFLHRLLPLNVSHFSHNFLIYIMQTIFYHLLVTSIFSSMTMQKPPSPAILTRIVHIIYIILLSVLMVFASIHLCIDYFLSLIFGRTMVKRNASRNDKLETMPQPTNSRITIAARDDPRGHNY
ncbi:unnamed protein product [Trifolium pratense]|uniref:Uncharacterized protein n=1 Tax=Trifolium pratense TaxID=57577 RepID=A0ACB0KD30_TRIPR|nr:unnamed protein product [Trifolium pratense]